MDCQQPWNWTLFWNLNLCAHILHNIYNHHYPLNVNLFGTIGFVTALTLITILLTILFLQDWTNNEIESSNEGPVAYGHVRF